MELAFVGAVIVLIVLLLYYSLRKTKSSASDQHLCGPKGFWNAVYNLLWMSTRQKRLVEFLESVHKQHAGQTVLVAAHGAIMKSLFMTDTFKNGYEVGYQTLNLDNCAILVIEADDNRLIIAATKELAFRG